MMEQLKQVSLPNLKNYAAGVKMVELPAAKVEGRSPKRKGAGTRKRGILVVDDEETIRQAHRRIPHRPKATAFLSPATALRRLKFIRRISKISISF